MSDNYFKTRKGRMDRNKGAKNYKEGSRWIRTHRKK